VQKLLLERKAELRDANQADLEVPFSSLSLSFFGYFSFFGYCSFSLLLVNNRKPRQQ
jgi:hypothetical protein